jgi:isoaspartyl peptidase/L-asparaginase-like protein (Ntn-hydrolase superfamily)
VRAAVELGWQILAAGAARSTRWRPPSLLEDDPAFDAGVGSHLNRNGEVELDAGLMEEWS